MYATYLVEAYSKERVKYNFYHCPKCGREFTILTYFTDLDGNTFRENIKRDGSGCDYIDIVRPLDEQLAALNKPIITIDTDTRPWWKRILNLW